MRGAHVMGRSTGVGSWWSSWGITRGWGRGRNLGWAQSTLFSWQAERNLRCEVTAWGWEGEGGRGGGGSQTVLSPWDHWHTL